MTTTRKLDPESLDRLDYLIYCLKEQGIYCYLDLLTYRKFKEDDGVPEHDLLGDKAHPWSMFDRRLIELQKVWLSKQYYREMYDYLREIGVKIPLTGTNWTKSMDNVRSHEEMDFTDSHHYFYDWRWGNVERICKNAAITSAPYVFPNMPRMRLANKPLFVSEWDMPWPNSYRAEGPIYYAAVGALQNWSGFTIHTYSYCSELYRDSILGREQSTPVDGVPYREGIFSTWNDPAKFGLFYHAALMLRRCDITPATKKVAVHATGAGKNQVTIWKSILEQHQAATTLDGSLPEGYDAVMLSTDFGVIALSSLTDDPISQSDNILLSAIGRARNTDMMFDGEKMLDIGRPPSWQKSSRQMCV